MPFDAFLRIEGIEGESADDKHKGWIDVVAFNWSVTRPKKKKELQALVIYKQIDTASPQLSAIACEGKALPNAQLEVTHAGENRSRFYQLLLQNVLVVGVEIEGVAAGEGGTPTEKVSLAYDVITVRYQRLDTKGTPLGGVVETVCLK